MKISVHGLGHVGSVTAACLASLGHTVTGVDTDHEKVHAISNGRSPIVETGLGELIRTATAQGLLSAVSSAEAAVRSSEVAIICVGTPSNPDGTCNLEHLKQVTQQIAEATRGTHQHRTVVIRSTIPPGTTEGLVIPLLERYSRKTVGEDLSVIFNPEFLREGSAVRDFLRATRIIVGTKHETRHLMVDMYKCNEDIVQQTSHSSAELIKYVENAFHALKISFSNEIGALAKSIGVDGWEIMEILCKDNTLNISSAYLRPGSPFGGSCLPKDLRAVSRLAHEHKLDVPLLDSIIPSNDICKSRLYNLIMNTKKKKIGILGLTFKPGTDDIRESPAVQLARQLSLTEEEIFIYDPSLTDLGRMTFREECNNLECAVFLDNMESVVLCSEVVVVTKLDPEFEDVVNLIRPGQVLIDLVHLPHKAIVQGDYVGVGW